MGCVLDCSVTLPWFLKDERSAFTDSLFAQLGKVEYWVPVVWHLEFSNALLMAERRKRTGRIERLEMLEASIGLALRTDGAPPDMRAISLLAERHSLSAYDASYLELAVRQGLALATVDRQLGAAAAAEGLALLAPGRSGVAQTRRRYAARAA